jgi:hypothetical protein
LKKNSLFSILSSYKASEIANPEENYSTESFVYILNFSKRNKTHLFSRFMKILEKEINLRDYERYEINTQNSFYGANNAKCIPDISVEAEEEIFFIEVKVESGLNVYLTENEEGNKEIINQIQRYQGIKSFKKKNIFLLTKYSCNLSYEDCNDFKNNIKWWEIYELLNCYKSDNVIENFLILEFKRYLEEKKMTIQKVSYELLNGMESLINLLEQLRSALEEIPYKNNSASLYLGYLLYLDLQDKQKKAHSGWVGLLLDKGKLVFQYLNKNAIKMIESKYSKDFIKEDGDYAINFDFEENYYFCLKPEDQLRKLKDWVDMNFKKLLTLSKEGT